MKYINTTLAASGQRRSYHASSSGSLGNCLHNLICLTQFPMCWHVCHGLQRSFGGAVSLAVLQELAPTEKREFLLMLTLRRRQNLAILHCGWQQQMILICRLLYHSLANALFFFSKCKKPGWLRGTGTSLHGCGRGQSVLFWWGVRDVAWIHKETSFISYWESFVRKVLRS